MQLHIFVQIIHQLTLQLFHVVLNIIMLLLMSVIGSNATDFPDIKGWQPQGEVLRYNSENLYEYINGAADQFIAYGFQLIFED